MEASSAGLQETEEGFQPVFFDPRPLRNLVLVDEMESLSPVTDLKARTSPGIQAAHQTRARAVCANLVESQPSLRGMAGFHLL